MPFDRSQLTEPLSDDQISSIIQASFGAQAEIIGCDPIPNVMFNTVYEIRTQNPNHHTILRIAPGDDKNIRRYEQSMMLVEPRIYDVIKQAGIPTARVLTVDDSRKIIDRDYIILDYIEGVPLSHSSVPEDVRPQIMQEVGRYTAQMHEISGDKFGWLTPDGSIRGSESWAEVFGELLTEMCEKNCEVGVISSDKAKSALDYYWSISDVFDEYKRPAFVHNDIWSPNIIVDEKDGKWQIEAIIDAERALFADPEFEYAIREGADENLMLGYGKPLDASENAILRRKFYQLELRMLYAWFHLDISPNPGFQAHSAKIVNETIHEFLSN